MLDSTRARLTLWYTGVLALALVVFAAVTYAYLARAARGRTDQSLADTANAVVSSFTTEMEDENQSGDAAAAEVARAFHFDDRQAIILDDAGRVLAATDAAANARGRHAWPPAPVLLQSAGGLLAAATRQGRAYATLPAHSVGIRAYAASINSLGRAYTVVVAQSLHEQDEELAQARRAFYLAVPFALLCASLGGYFLARKSLAPIVAMGARAARIGAANLGERLPVGNERSELGRLAQTFNELLARLDLSFEQQRRFMADASHELRTPVAIVCGESEVALSQTRRSVEEYRESLAILHDEGRRLTRIVEDLFLLARADAGQYRPAATPFYLDEAVGECVRAVRSLATQHGLELHYRPPEDELPLRGDEGLVRRMVLNLLDNAIKYTPRGGQVRVRLERADADYKISVTDTGRGIPAEARPHIFERFYRADKARPRDGATDGSGAGLGLAIALWVAELHGGRITLKRTDNSGTTFVVSLPSSVGAAPA
ncbi:MAG TPA: heavy metal sensor histidine kinase [Pyrinomonadaceae bacterium]